MLASDNGEVDEVQDDAEAEQGVVAEEEDKEAEEEDKEAATEVKPVETLKADKVSTAGQVESLAEVG